MSQSPTLLQITKTWTEATVGQAQLRLRLFADGDIVVLEEDGRVGDDECQVRIVHRLKPEEVVLVARLDHREARVIGESEKTVGEGHDAVVLDH